MTENPEVSEPGFETKPLGSGSMLVKIFTEPSAVFKSVKVKSTWALPVILLVILTIVAGIVSFPFQLDMQKQTLEQREGLSQEQRDAALQQMEGARGNMVYAAIGAVVQGAGVIVFMLIMVGLYMLMGSVILGGSAPFSKVFSVAAWGSMPSLVGTVIKIPLMQAKQSMDVRTSLALLMPDSKLTDPVVAILNSLTDVFIIWSIVLSVIGIAIVYSFSKGKAAVVVLVPAAILAAIGAGLASAFGG